MLPVLEATRQSNSEAIECRVRAAIDKLSASGAIISFYAVAKEAYVARSTLYRRPELKMLVEAARQNSLAQARTSDASNGNDAPDVAALRQALAAAEAEIARLLALGTTQERAGLSFSYAVCSF